MNLRFWPGLEDALSDLSDWQRSEGTIHRPAAGVLLRRRTTWTDPSINERWDVGIAYDLVGDDVLKSGSESKVELACNWPEILVPGELKRSP